MNQRKFSKEFKMEILREIDSGKTMGQVCREHQLNKSMVYYWKKSFQENPEHAFSGKGNPSTTETKVDQLERTIGELYVENCFLKKALGFLEKKLSEIKKQK